MQDAVLTAVEDVRVSFRLTVAKIRKPKLVPENGWTMHGQAERKQKQHSTCACPLPARNSVKSEIAVDLQKGKTPHRQDANAGRFRCPDHRRRAGRSTTGGTFG